MSRPGHDLDDEYDVCPDCGMDDCYGGCLEDNR